MSCVDCERCPPGQGLSHECGTSIYSDAMVTCKACISGKSFSESFDTSSCSPCAPPCLKDQVVLQKCTPTKNIRCAKECHSKDRYSRFFPFLLQFCFFEVCHDKLNYLYCQSCFLLWRSKVLSDPHFDRSFVYKHIIIIIIVIIIFIIITGLTVLYIPVALFLFSKMSIVLPPDICQKDS